MNISRRHLTGPLPVLGLLAVGLLGVKTAQAMTADDEAIAKRLEAFRTAQAGQDAKAFDGLCSPELSYSHSDGHIEDKATFITNATAGKSAQGLIDALVADARTHITALVNGS